MKITHFIAQHIQEVYEGNNWTDVSIISTIKSITWQQAQQKTAASPNTIASLMHHLYYWNGVIMQRLKGSNPSIPEINGYNVSEFKNENDWQKLKERTHESFIQLASLIKHFPEEKLEETYAEGKSSYYKNFQGIVEHAHYHLGQIVILKNIVQSTQL
ncbi:MAG: DinB family protein [Parafilimonas sp.]